MPLLFFIFNFVVSSASAQTTATEITNTETSADPSSAVRQSCPAVDAGAINRLKAYVICQSSPSIAACAGVATGIAGRMYVRQQPNLKYPPLTQQNVEILTSELASQIYANENGITASESVLKFRNISPALQAVYIQQARTIVVNTLRKATLGQIDDILLSQIIHLSTRASKKYGTKIVVGQIDDPILAYMKTVVAQINPMNSERALQTLATTQAATAGLSASTEAFAERSTSRAIGIAFAKLLAWSTPFVGALIDVAFSARPVGCDQPGDFYRNKDDGCGSVYEINENVFSFLKLTEQEQLQELQNPQSHLCEYYTHLQEKIFEQPRFVGLTCSAQGFELKLQTATGKKSTYKALYYSRSHNIKQVNLNKPNPIEIEANGVVRGISSESIAQDVVPLKLFIMDAYDCCTTAYPSLQTACLAQYNHP